MYPTLRFSVRKKSLKKGAGRKCGRRCLAAVIATAELNKKPAEREQREGGGEGGAGGRGDAKRKRTSERRKLSRPSPANQTPLDFLPSLHPPSPTTTTRTTTREGGCSRRTAHRLTRHIITPLPPYQPVHPSFSVRLTMLSYPSARFVLFLLFFLLLLLSSRSLHPSIFHPVATLRASIRAGQLPLGPRHPPVGAIWPPLHAGYITAALLNYARYFSSRGE